MNPTRLKAILRKEVFHLLRDTQSLSLAFAVPLVLIVLFGYALSLDVDQVKTVVVDSDRSSASRDFIRRFEASTYFSVDGYLSRSKDAIGVLDRDEAKVVLIIGPDFGKNLQADREARVQVLLEGSDPNYAGIVRGYLTALVEQYNQKLLVEYLNRRGMEPISPPVEGRIRIWFNEDLQSRNFIVPGIIAIIIMIVGALLTSLIIAREYEQGTMETLKSLPLSAGELLLGKALPYFGIGFADVLIAMLGGQILFGVVMKGSFGIMMLATTLYLCVALALGLTISTLTKSQLVANQAAILITYLPSVLLSNFVFPIANMPKFLQAITYIVPARYYIDILGGLYLRNTNLAYLWPSLAVLALMAAGLTAISYLLLKREGL